MCLFENCLRTGPPIPEPAGRAPGFVSLVGDRGAGAGSNRAGGSGVDDAVSSQSTQAVGGSSPVYEVLWVEHSGVRKRRFVKRKEILRQQRLQARDLRRVDSSLGGAKDQPSLVLREQCMLINLGGVKGIVTREGMIVFEPDSRPVARFLQLLQPSFEKERLQGPDGEATGAAVGSSGDFDGGLPSLEVGEHAPFQMECVEAALKFRCEQLEARLERASGRAVKLLQKLPQSINPENLEELRRLKTTLVTLESLSDTMQELLEELLDDDDEIVEIARFFDVVGPTEGLGAPTGPSTDSALVPGSPEVTHVQAAAASAAEAGLEGQFSTWMEGPTAGEREVDLIEDLFEYYYQRCAVNFTEAERLLAGMRDLEESISVVLSSRRYEVNRLELILSMASFAAALGAVVSGIFGMNLRSTLEMSVVGFYGATTFIAFMCISVFVLLYEYTKGRNIL